MKKRVACIKTGGLSGGGCEKYLQTIMMSLSPDEFERDFYYTDAFPTEGTDWIHPGTDLKRKQLMESAGIRLIEVTLPKRAAGYPGEWLNTNLLQHFDPSKYDVLLTATKGETEWPFCTFTELKQVETIHGSTFDSGAGTGATRFVLLAEWQRAHWVAAGGPKERSVVIPSLVKTPEKVRSTLREKLGIPSDAFVCGMHQADRDDIFSPVPLQAFTAVQRQRPCHFIMLGGSKRYQEQAKQLGTQNIHFLNFESDPQFISQVLGALDLYAHGRADGEVCSACIIEALYHDLPILSVFGTNNGHVEQIGEAGTVVATAEDYARALFVMATDSTIRSNCSKEARRRYEEVYRFELNREKLVQLVREVAYL